MNIPYINLNLQWKKEKRDLLKIIDKVLSAGEYVNTYALEIQKF